MAFDLCGNTSVNVYLTFGNHLSLAHSTVCVCVCVCGEKITHILHIFSYTCKLNNLLFQVILFALFIGTCYRKQLPIKSFTIHVRLKKVSTTSASYEQQNSMAGLMLSGENPSLLRHSRFLLPVFCLMQGVSPTQIFCLLNLISAKQAFSYTFRRVYFQMTGSGVIFSFFHLNRANFENISYKIHCFNLFFPIIHFQQFNNSNQKQFYWIKFYAQNEGFIVLFREFNPVFMQLIHQEHI